MSSRSAYEGIIAALHEWARGYDPKLRLNAVLAKAGDRSLVTSASSKVAEYIGGAADRRLGFSLCLMEPWSEGADGLNARAMAEERGFAADFDLTEAVERVGIPLVCERTHRRLPMCANVDLYSGLIYRMLGIPEELFTPLFAIARIAGWCAHRLEELMTGKRIIRPAYRSSMTYSDFVPLEERG